MKRSHIFWNIMIIVAEIIIGLIIFGFEPDMIGYLAVIWGGLHSLGLLGDIFDRKSFDDDDFFPAFLFVSILGVFILILAGVFYTVIKIGESRWNPVKYIANPIKRFNDWLDGKK